MIILTVLSFIISFSLIAFNSVDASKPWKVNYKDTEKLCLYASFSGQLIVKGEEKKPIDLLPDNTNVTEEKSSCGEDSAILSLHWTENGMKISTFSIKFHKKSDDLTVEEIEYDINYFKGNFTKQFSNVDLTNKFKVKVSEFRNGYKCTAEEIDVDNDLTLKLSKIQWEVFRDQNNNDIKEKKFIYTPYKCEKDVQLNKSMPIIIGIVMAALVAVVVVILIFGRIRSRRNLVKKH
jgi:hypothetical protein